MNQELLQEFKNALQKEHDTIVTELKAFARPDPKIKGNWEATFPKFEEVEYGSHAGQDEEAEEVEEYEARLEAEHSLETRLLQVTKALERIQIGSYGVCVRCKKPIETDRLRANPATEFCLMHIPV